MNLLVRPTDVGDSAEAQQLSITPESAGWQHVGFYWRELLAGNSYTHVGDGREQCLVVMAGRVDVQVSAPEQEQHFVGIGGRATVFDGPPHAVYAPAGATITISTHPQTDRAEIALCSAPRRPEAPLLPARHIAPEQIDYEVRGQTTNVRHVYNILPETEPADNLLVVEVITPSGCWSSYPPHKHDSATPDEETALEEVYFYKTNPPQGFAFQRVYTDDASLDETVAPQTNDAVLVPRGYHPVGAPHGYDIYYLNVMAGDERKWIFRNDPKHEWIVKRG